MKFSPLHRQYLSCGLVKTEIFFGIPEFLQDNSTEHLHENEGSVGTLKSWKLLFFHPLSEFTLTFQRVEICLPSLPFSALFIPSAFVTFGTALSTVPSSLSWVHIKWEEKGHQDVYRATRLEIPKIVFSQPEVTKLKALALIYLWLHRKRNQILLKHAQEKAKKQQITSSS